MSGRPEIKILVSCHKEVVCPRSRIYLPVQVGAHGKKTIPGMQRDDDGDNISERNFTYSELTAQYWAWKNLDADYVGQCHYRRYFCFDGVRRPTNDHAQIEEACLDERALAAYRIDDEGLIRSVVEGCDLVCAPTWNVLGAPTPSGTKGSVRAHMVGYGLVTDEEIDELVAICRRVQPEYLDDLISSLEGRNYLGYNCFIMRRNLFDRLCEFEFSILSEFDRGRTYAGMTATHRRLCGYLGEILYSAFVARLRREGDYRIVQAPLVFFENTPVPYRLTTSAGRISIFWRTGESSTLECSVMLRHLFSQLNESRKYEITLLHELSLDEPLLRRLIGELPVNLSLVCACTAALQLPPEMDSVNELERDALLPFVPTASNEGEGYLWLDGLALFDTDPATLLDGAESIRALQGIKLERELNRPVNQALRERYCKAVSSRDALSSRVMAVGVSRGVEALLADYRFQLASIAKDVEHPSEAEILAAQSALLVSLGASSFSFGETTAALDSEDTMRWTSAETASRWSASAGAGVLLYDECSPLDDPLCWGGVRFWRCARETSAYEALLVTMGGVHGVSLKDRLFPPHSPSRKFLGRVNGLLRHVARRD